MDNTNNKKYWDDYVSYWESRVEDANIDKKIKDKTPDDLILEKYYKKLNVSKKEVFLDYGCGSGRLFPIYHNNTEGGYRNYYGIDISRIPLEHARNNYGEINIQGQNLKEFDGINIPFENGYFDKIICFGVFDACNQEKTINELIRVLKVEGLLLVTGKNNNYHQEDSAAAIAELNARKNGFPNHFTDVHNLLGQLKENKVDVVDSYYFLRRGDFANDFFVKELPNIFYEYALILRKGIYTKNNEYVKFSKEQSLHIF
jgi:SAM-dependent methyltransferase